jgi:hypothetical protein
LVPALLVVSLLAAAGVAPMQCSKTRDGDLRREDAPGDALWELAQRFEAEGNPAGAKATLQFLVDRYPGSRFAQAARDVLAGKRGLDGGA